MPRFKPIVLVLLLVAIAYVPGIRFPFIYDDLGTITENPLLSQPGYLARILTLDTLSDPAVVDGQRPVLLLVNLFDWSIWGSNPVGWHLTNIALHLLAVFAFYRLLGVLLERAGQPASGSGPWVGALLFGLHPVLSEAVQLPSYREDLLAGLFVFLYLLAVAHRRLFPAVALFVLAMFSKESALFAPALAPLVAAGVHNKHAPSRRAMILHVGLCAASILLAGAAVYSGRTLQASSAPSNGISLNLPDDLDRIPAIFTLSLQLILSPWPLCADHAVPVGPAFPGVLIYLALLFFAWHYREIRPVRSIGCVWLVLAFLPVSNLIPLFNPVGERYLYLLVPAAVALAVERIHAYRGSRLFALFCAICGFALIQARLPDWESDRALWDSVTRIRGAEYGARALTWQGISEERKYLAETDSEERDRYFNQAKQLFHRADDLSAREDVTALVRLAVLHGRRDEFGVAEQLLLRAIERRPDRADAWQNLALALYHQGRMQEAQDAAEQAIQLSQPR